MYIEFLIIGVVLAVLYFGGYFNAGGKDKKMHMTSLCEEFISKECVITFEDNGREKVQAKLLGYDEHNIKYETTKKDVKRVVLRKVDDIIEISSVC